MKNENFGTNASTREASKMCDINYKQRSSMKKLLSCIAMIALTGTAVCAQQPSPVRMETHSYQLKVVKDKKGKIVRDKQGKPVKKWVKASRVVPGTVVKYVDTITNDSDQPIRQATISNPINPNLSFIAGSPASKSKFSVKYSVDGGKHYDVPQKLFVVGKDQKKHPAQPKDYTAIQFIVDEVPAHSRVDVSFKVKLK